MTSVRTGLQGAAPVAGAGLRLLLGREWFVEPGRTPAARVNRDIL